VAWWPNAEAHRFRAHTYVTSSVSFLVNVACNGLVTKGGLRLLYNLEIMPGAKPLRDTVRQCLSWDPTARPTARSSLDQIRRDSRDGASSGSGREFPKGKGKGKGGFGPGGKRDAAERAARYATGEASLLGHPGHGARPPWPRGTAGGMPAAPASGAKVTPATELGCPKTSLTEDPRPHQLSLPKALSDCGVLALLQPCDQAVPHELFLVKALSDCGTLDLMQPCDLVGHVWAMASLHGFLSEAVVALLKDPVAIQAFGGCAPCGGKPWTGEGLEKALYATPRPYQFGNLVVFQSRVFSGNLVASSISASWCE
jgi:hypothetical protein